MVESFNYTEQSDKNLVTFLLDSGAKDHIINDESLLADFVELRPSIKLSVAKKGNFITSAKKGTMKVVSNLGVSSVLENLLFSPDDPHTLLSVQKLQQAGMTIVFDE